MLFIMDAASGVEFFGTATLSVADSGTPFCFASTEARAKGPKPSQALSIVDLADDGVGFIGFGSIAGFDSTAGLVSKVVPGGVTSTNTMPLFSSRIRYGQGGGFGLENSVLNHGCIHLYVFSVDCAKEEEAASAEIITTTAIQIET